MFTRGRLLTVVCASICLAASCAEAESTSALQPPPPPAPAAAGDAPADWETRLQALEQRLEEQSSPPRSEPDARSAKKLDWKYGYNEGFFWRGVNEDGDRFSLKINARAQMRHEGLVRDRTTWRDSAGVVRPVDPRNQFDIERMRLIFSGHTFTEDLTYFLQLDGDTDDGHTVDLLDAFWGYKVWDDVRILIGKRKVPGTHQWQLSGFDLRFTDRPMATEFFRPDRTVGVWAVGTLGDPSLHYDVMIGNGYRTPNLTADQINDRFALAASMWWEPWGDFGPDLVHLGDDDGPRMRLGHNLIHSRQSGLDQLRLPVAESNIVRFGNATLLTSRGALAPGVQVDRFTVLVYALEAAWKWELLSLNAEYYLQWVDNIGGDGPLPRTRFFQHGYMIEGGCFLVPETVDVNLRHSQIYGFQGQASEYAVGCNWFILKQNLRVTFDATYLDGNPVRSTGADLLPGERGVLFRTQLQARF